MAWTATYTYILLLFVAAAFIAYIGRPRNREEAVKRLYPGELLPFDSETESVEPILKVRCGDNGKVVFERLGVPHLTTSGAVSLAVTFIGKNVEVLERVTAGYSSDPEMAGASFIIDMTGREWRHVKWMDEDSGLWCAFTLHLRPGISFTVPLKR